MTRTRALSFLGLLLVLACDAVAQEDVAWMSKRAPTCSSGAVSSACKCGGSRVTTGYCCSGVAQAGACLLFDDDAGTVCHPYFDGSSIQDTKGCAWVQDGTVPMVAASGSLPAGGGPMSDVNAYHLGTGNDALDFSSVNFSACFAVGPLASYATYPVIFTNGLYNSIGYYFGAGNTGAAGIGIGSGGIKYTPEALVAGSLNLICGGFVPGAPGTFSIKLNLGTYTTQSGSCIGATAKVARLGRYDANGQPWTGTIYEAWFSTTAPSDAAFIAIANKVKTRAGISAW